MAFFDFPSLEIKFQFPMRSTKFLAGWGYFSVA